MSLQQEASRSSRKLATDNCSDIVACRTALSGQVVPDLKIEREASIPESRNTAHKTEQLYSWQGDALLIPQMTASDRFDDAISVCLDGAPFMCLRVPQ